MGRMCRWIAPALLVRRSFIVPCDDYQLSATVGHQAGPSSQFKPDFALQACSVFSSQSRDKLGFLVDFLFSIGTDALVSSRYPALVFWSQRRAVIYSDNSLGVCCCFSPNTRDVLS